MEKRVAVKNRGAPLVLELMAVAPACTALPLDKKSHDYCLMTSHQEEVPVHPV